MAFYVKHASLSNTRHTGGARPRRNFLSNHKSNSAADANARDAAIVCSIALQCGADIETIRRALSRDSRGHTTGPLGVALDLICGEGER